MVTVTVGAGRLEAQHEHAQAEPAAAAGADSTGLLGAAGAVMSAPMGAAHMKHMELSPTRSATHDDTLRARGVVLELRTSLAKYADTAAAVADGYRMFAPSIKNQRVYHFTNYRNAFLEAFRFDPDKPTSILYARGADGRFRLAGAMYTAPKRMTPQQLDERVPLSIARWHKHVNWCVPRPGDRGRERWMERRDGLPVFGPESPIATRSECRAVGGLFLASPMGWMVHANVFAEELGAVFAH